MMNMFNGISTPNFEEKTMICKQHGKYTSYLIRSGWTSCKECRIIEDLKQEHLAAKMRYQQKVWNQAEIPDGFEHCVFSNYECYSDQQKNVFNNLKEFANNIKDNVINGNSLLLYGTPGTGKTHLAISIVKTALENKINARYIRFLTYYNKTFGEKATMSIDELITLCSEPNLLVLDECWAKHTDGEINAIFDIVSARHQAKKSTIILTNLTTGFDRRVAWRIASLKDYTHKHSSYAFTWKSWAEICKERQA